MIRGGIKGGKYGLRLLQRKIVMTDSVGFFALNNNNVRRCNI
jgi:hypothetical protein